MEGGSLLQDDFAQWSKNFVLFNHITTRIQGEKYGNLLQEKGGQGFPYLVFMDSDGNVITEHYGSRDAAGFAKSGAKVQAYFDLKAKSSAGDKTVAFDLLLAELDLKSMPKEQLAARLKELGELNAEQKAKLQPLQVLNDVRHVLTNIDRRNPQGIADAGKQFAEMQKAGRTPAGDGNEALNFWLLLNKYADDTKDAALMESALKVLQTILPESPKKAEWIAKEQARIKELQGGGK